jgi:hypothetical protein
MLDDSNACARSARTLALDVEQRHGNGSLAAERRA